METAQKWCAASFNVRGEELQLDDVGTVLGIAATRTHLRGQPRGPKNEAVWHDSFWSLKCPLSSDQPLGDHLTWLLEILNSRLDVVEALSKTYRVDFLVGFSSGDKQGGFTLESAILARFANLSVPLVFDLYSPASDDEGELDRSHTSENRTWSTAALRVIGEGLQSGELEAAFTREAPRLYSSQLWPIPGGEPYRGELWSLDSSLGNKRGVTEQLWSLLDLVEPKLDVVKALSETYRTDLFCTFASQSGQGGFVLDGPTLARIVRLGIPLGVELYPPGFVECDGAGAELQ